ncbi:MAG: hypothetical protein ACXWQO_19975 [Bdellovibrionota bacterium]
MAEKNSTESELSLTAIIVGAATASIFGLTMLSATTGFAVAVFHADSSRNISAAGYATMMILGIIRSFIAFAAGGYVTGYFSPRGSLFESRMHGFAAFALASLVIAFYLASPSSAVLRNVINTTSSYIESAPGTLTAASPPPLISGPMPVRRPSAGTYFLTAVFAMEGAVAAFWAAGEANVRRTRLGLKGIAREQASAA